MRLKCTASKEGIVKLVRSCPWLRAKVGKEVIVVESRATKAPLLEERSERITATCSVVRRAVQSAVVPKKSRKMSRASRG